MKILNALGLLAFVLATVPLQVAQEEPTLARTAENQSDSIPIFYWNKNSDVSKWLRENEALLNRGDGCSLLYAWSNEANPGGPQGSWFNIALFVVTPEDEEVKELIHSKDGDVRVGVRYFPIKPGLSEIDIALAFEGAAADVFDDLSGAQAKAHRDKNWKSLGVARTVRVGHMRYHYSLTCENGKTFLDYFRRPIQRRPH